MLVMDRKLTTKGGLGEKKHMDQRRGNTIVYAPNLHPLLNSSGKAEIFVLE